MYIKKQTEIPASFVRRAEAENFERRAATQRRATPTRTTQEVVFRRSAAAAAAPASRLTCPACESTTEVEVAPAGAAYPLVCRGCGTAGARADFGSYAAPKSNAFRPLGHGRFPQNVVEAPLAPQEALRLARQQEYARIVEENERRRARRAGRFSER